MPVSDAQVRAAIVAGYAGESPRYAQAYADRAPYDVRELVRRMIEAALAVPADQPHPGDP